MAKKRHAEEQELPFVALMDTMTNVVGVLTIVMVMIGIGLARAANRVFSALPPATAEQVRAAQADLDRLRAAQAPLLETLKALAKPELTPAQLAALDAELARLERQMKEKGVKLPDLDAQQRELARLEAELKQKKIEVDKMLAERDRLKALLDQTPVVEAPPANTMPIVRCGRGCVLRVAIVIALHAPVPPAEARLHFILLISTHLPESPPWSCVLLPIFCCSWGACWRVRRGLMSRPRASRLSRFSTAAI